MAIDKNEKRELKGAKEKFLAKNFRREIKINTPIGERTLRFIYIDTTGKEEVLCESVCPLGDICEEVRNPENPADPNDSFCNGICSNPKKDIFSDYIPEKGTLEEVLSILHQIDYEN